MKDALREQKTFLLAFWHGDEIPLIQLSRKYRIATIVSTSKDGSMMNTVIRLLGGTTTRGSSTRGAVNALKGLIRLIKEGKYNAGFAVDGPKGPLHVVKPGVFEVSRLLASSGVGTIFVAGVACDRAWHFPKSWNKAFLPKPFSNVVIVWQGPYGPVQKGEDPRDLALANSLAEALHKAKAEAVKKIAVH